MTGRRSKGHRATMPPPDSNVAMANARYEIDGPVAIVTIDRHYVRSRVARTAVSAARVFSASRPSWLS
jgi:hypothetical protein